MSCWTRPEPRRPLVCLVLGSRWRRQQLQQQTEPPCGHLVQEGGMGVTSVLGSTPSLAAVSAYWGPVPPHTPVSLLTPIPNLGAGAGIPLSEH